MIVKVTNTETGEYKGTFPVDGENFALGLAAVKHTCRCGQARFVDGGDTVTCSCGLTLEYSEDEAEHTGFLHPRAD